MLDPVALRFERLAKAYDGPPIFSNLSLEIDRGLLAITGPNGSGKSTLLKLAAGLLRPSEGRADVLRNGRPLEGDERRSATGWLSPELAFYDALSARENLSFFAAAAGRPRKEADILRRLSHVSLEAADRPVGAFSSGMIQRLRLAFAFLFDPPVVLLDEPASNLDEAGRRLLAELVDRQRRDGIVVVATNDSKDLERPEATIELGRVPRAGCQNRDPTGHLKPDT